MAFGVPASMLLFIIFLGFKILCFSSWFFGWKLPKKTLGLLYRFMLSLVKGLYKMGCIFCSPGGSDDDFPKKNRTDKMLSSSGKYTQHSTKVHHSGQHSVEGSGQFRSSPSAAVNIPTEPVTSQNRANRSITDSLYNKGPQQFESVQSAAVESLKLANQNMMKTGSILEARGSSPIARISPMQSGRGERHDNAVLYQVDETNKRYLKKHQVSPVRSFPATQLPKSPLDYTGINSYPSYDSSSYWNARAAGGKSSLEGIQMPTTSSPDPYDRNSYRLLNESRKKKHLSNEASARTTLTSEEQLSVSSLILTSDPSQHKNELMEVNSSLKRHVTSSNAQHLGLIEGNRVDEYTSGSTKRFKETPLDKEVLTNEQILTELECRLRKTYNERFASGKVQHFYFDVCTLEESGQVQRKLTSFSELFPPTPTWRMLMYGKPFFGKTQLCHDVTVIWNSTPSNETADEFANIRRFKILVHHNLKPKGDLDLEKRLVDICHKMLPKNYVTKNELKEAWNSCMSQTLVILDGYDKLSSSEKHCVNLSLRQNFFNEASILLTCRPDVDAKLGESFNIHVDICGFSKTLLFELTNYKTHQLNSFDDCKVEMLEGVSPFYAQAVVNSFNQVHKPKSLYDLLDSVFNFLTESRTLSDLTFDIIGSFFLEGLKCRWFVFEEAKLRELLSKSWKDLQSFGLFVACPSKPNETRKLIVSHKLFMVYFSVRYLRGKWNKLTHVAQRELFLKTQLCFEDSSPVYLGTSEEKPKLFFAGVIPEIVFDFHNDVFQMVQDVSEPVLTAFEVQSLLLRVDSKRLHVFGITKVENTDFQHFFEGILSILDFWGLTTDVKFFVAVTGNTKLYYLKAVVIDEDANRPVMMIVASVNPENSDRIQEVHLDFLESNFKILHSFLLKFAEIFFGSCQFEPEMSGVDIVFHIVSRCFAFDCDQHTQLTIASESFNSSALVTWEIMSSSRGRPNSTFTYLNETGTVLRKYDSVACQNLLREPNRSRVTDRMNRSVMKFSELVITINVKSVL